MAQEYFHGETYRSVVLDGFIARAGGRLLQMEQTRPPLGVRRVDTLPSTDRPGRT